MPPGVGALGLPSAAGAGALAARHRGERREVEAGAERGALAREHHDPDARRSDFSCSPASRSAGEHRAVERVALVGPVHAHVGDAPVVDADGHTIAHRAIVACHAHRHEAEPVRRRSPDHDPQRPQAPGPREAGRSRHRRGGPGDRPPGADGLQPPGLALGRDRGRRQAAKPSPPCTNATSRSTARRPAPSTRRATAGPSARTAGRATPPATCRTTSTRSRCC